MNLQVITKSADETEKVGYILAKSIIEPTIIVLEGDLGAGKTVFVKGFSKGLGIEEVITSPTFTIMNEYNGRLPLYHFDIYRIEDASEIEELGFNEYLDKATLKGVSIIEWADKLLNLINDEYIKVSIEKISDNSRKITIGESNVSNKYSI